MAGPWEKYGSGPWQKYSQQTTAPQDIHPPPITAGDRVQAAFGGANRGIAAVAGIPVDLGLNLLDLGKAAIGYPYSKITGNAVPEALQPVQDRSTVLGSSANIAKALNAVGVNTNNPRPDDAASRYLYAGGAAAPAVLTGRPSSAMQMLSQGGQAAAIGMVPQAVVDAGGSDSAATAATLGASILLPATVAGVRAVNGGAQSFNEAGRRQIAGAALRGAATNADDAVANLESSKPLVPGSNPTAGQAAKDPGIAYFENRIRAVNGGSFAERLSNQNNARQKLLDTVARGGDSKAISMLESRREAITTKLRDTAFQQAHGKPVPTQQVIQDIDALISNPENAGRSVQQALKAVRDQLFNQKGAMLDDARQLYAVRKEINRILEGKYVGAEESVLRYAGGQLANVRSSIDNAITEVAPGWKEYLTKYAQLSKPIDRATEIGAIRERTRLAAPDIQTGRDYISQPKWRNVVGANQKELASLLTKGQMQKMQMIAADLDRGAAASNSTNIRPPGSDTAANLATQGQISVANIVGRVLGKDIKELPPALATVTRPLSWVYKLPDDQIKTLIVDAMLDPKLAAQLMREGTRENIQSLADSLRGQAELSGILIATQGGRKEQP